MCSDPLKVRAGISAAPVAPPLPSFSHIATMMRILAKWDQMLWRPVLLSSKFCPNEIWEEYIITYCCKEVIVLAAKSG